MATLEGKTIIALTADAGVERVELTEPRSALEEAGARVLLASPSGDQVQTFDGLDKAGSVPADLAISAVDASTADGFLLPGGVVNGDFLRTDEDAVRLLRDALRDGVPVAVICHGPWTLVETGQLQGRRMTSWPSLRTDLTNAGADWHDEQVVVCEAGPGMLVSSRKPGDIPAFSQAAIKAYAA